MVLLYSVIVLAKPYFFAVKGVKGQGCGLNLIASGADGKLKDTVSKQDDSSDL